MPVLLAEVVDVCADSRVAGSYERKWTLDTGVGLRCNDCRPDATAPRPARWTATPRRAEPRRRPRVAVRRVRSLITTRVTSGRRL